MERWQYISEIQMNAPIAADSYLVQIPAIRQLEKMRTLPLNAPVTFLVGENGSGKSTLLEAIAIAYGFNPEGGTRNFNFSTEDSHSGLWKNMTLIKRNYPSDGFFLRAESFYNVATYIDSVRAEESYGGVSLHSRSHGESFLALVQNRFMGKGLYIIDEPEAALSPSRLLTLMAEIDALVKDDSQFIIATHSPILMAFPGAEIYELSSDGIKSVQYRDTEHYRITKTFLADPERMLKYLLD